MEDRTSYALSHRNIMTHVTPYLVGRDLEQLRGTCKSISRAVHDTISRVYSLESILSLFVHDVPFFKHILIERFGVVSGSSIVQYITGERYAKSDLDIYVRDFYGIDKVSNVLCILDYLRRVERYTLLPTEETLYPEHQFKRLVRGDKIIDLIYSHSDNDVRPTIASFYLITLMNYWDPSSDKIMTIDLETVLNKRIIATQLSLKNEFDRSMKEMSEGERNITQESLEESGICRSAVKNIIGIIKYLDRGFTLANNGNASNEFLTRYARYSGMCLETEDIYYFDSRIMCYMFSEIPSVRKFTRF
jgi:hypothetical protein